MIKGYSRRKYFGLATRAWNAHALRNNLDERDAAAFDAWRRAEMQAVCGVRSTLDLDPVKGMDAIMLHWAIICGDEKEIAYWSTASERRMRRRIEIAMRRLAEIEHRTVTWQYIRAILHRMNLPEDIQDCPAEMLWKAYQALDTHVRRVTERAA